MNIQKTAPTPKLVTMIPADPQMTERDLRKKHLRVAPYCRVSTDKEEQLSSYEAQIEYYTEKIDANPDWTMVRLYADEGITGTSAKKRKDFLQMIRDCERGKIDLVITKSVSRFCRNTLDGLNYVRRLKRHGVGVYFEKENVNTLFMDNEMILTFIWDWCEYKLDLDVRFPAPQTEDTLDCALLEGELASKLLAALREQDLQELAAEIAPEWDLPTEAVQSGLETLRSHLELVQGDAALLYEMT